MKKMLLCALIYISSLSSVFAAETDSIVIPPIHVEITDKLENGESFNSYLQQLGFSGRDAYLLSYKVNKAYNLKKLQRGQELVTVFTDDINTPISNRRLARLDFYTPKDKRISLYKEADSYNVETSKRRLKASTQYRTGIIDSSLYNAAEDAKLPIALVAGMVEPFAWDIDFSRDFRKGDSFKVIYKEILDEKGRFLRHGPVLAVELNLARRGTLKAYRYKPKNGRSNYYNEEGESRRKSLLRTPLNFKRISSHFNPKRKHPVLGYTRAHKGTDFAAATGTPIKAAGDGRIVRRSWYGGYGRYIKIRHNAKYETAYAHMHRYKRGLKVGSYVRQGDIIGYVGTSGRSTGPHLHYELIVNGRKVNAMRAKLPKGKSLPKNEMVQFKKEVDRLSKLLNPPQKIAKKNSPQ